MKKNILLLLSGLFILSFCRCKKDDKPLFEMTYTQTFEMAAGLNPIDEHVYIIRDIASDTTRFFTAGGKRVSSQLSAINPLGMKMFNVSSGAKFDFLERVSVTMFTDDDPTYEKEIFYREQIQDSRVGVELDLVPTFVDAKSMLLKGKYNLKVKLKPYINSPEFIATRCELRFGAK